MEANKTIKYILAEHEIRQAIYEYFVRKFKSNDIDAIFQSSDIDIYNNGLGAELKITENKKIE